MLKALKPLKTIFYTAFVLYVLIFFDKDIATIFPAALFLVALHGFESFYRADLDHIYGKRKVASRDRLSLFRVSLFVAILSLVTSFYFELSLFYIALPILAIVATSLNSSYQFVSDLLVSLTYPLLLMLHSSDLMTLAPLYWFVFFQELAIRSTYQLSRPYGMETFNLPRILGSPAALEFTNVINFLSVLWPVLMARYTYGIGFFVFIFSAMILSAGIYALMVGHLEKSEILVRVSSVAFLAGLYSGLL
ncbi:MAG: hypothetical protein GOU98_03045 [Candidatus Altiarchaeota archaeon]|nr:hypothetical protein [Candidatus Altiarchaeota archaeon]